MAPGSRSRSSAWSVRPTSGRHARPTQPEAPRARLPGRASLAPPSRSPTPHARSSASLGQASPDGLGEPTGNASEATAQDGNDAPLDLGVPPPSSRVVTSTRNPLPPRDVVPLTTRSAGDGLVGHRLWRAPATGGTQRNGTSGINSDTNDDPGHAGRARDGPRRLPAGSGVFGPGTGITESAPGRGSTQPSAGPGRARDAQRPARWPGLPPERPLLRQRRRHGAELGCRAGHRRPRAR